MKKEIRYLDRADYLSHLDAISQMKLAYFRYTWEEGDEKEHLGFIIDDVANAKTFPAIANDGQTVDFYGFVSMAIAAIKAQSVEIQALKNEIEFLKRNQNIKLRKPSL